MTGRRSGDPQRPKRRRKAGADEKTCAQGARGASFLFGSSDQSAVVLRGGWGSNWRPVRAARRLRRGQGESPSEGSAEERHSERRQPVKDDLEGKEVVAGWKPNDFD